MAWIRFRNFIARMCNGSSLFNSSCCGRKKIIIIVNDHDDINYLHELIQSFVFLVENGDKDKAMEFISNGLSKQTINRIH